TCNGGTHRAWLQRGGGGGGPRTTTNRRPPGTLSLFVPLALSPCICPRRPSSRRRIAPARATRSHACASFPGLPPISEPLFCPGPTHSHGIRGCPRRSTSWCGQHDTDKRIPRRRRQPTCFFTIAIAAIPGR